MYNPNDDPDVTSGLQDDAKKEMTTPGTSDQNAEEGVLESGSRPRGPREGEPPAKQAPVVQAPGATLYGQARQPPK